MYVCGYGDFPCRRRRWEENEGTTGIPDMKFLYTFKVIKSTYIFEQLYWGIIDILETERIIAKSSPQSRLSINHIHYLQKFLCVPFLLLLLFVVRTINMRSNILLKLLNAVGTILYHKYLELIHLT